MIHRDNSINLNTGKKGEIKMKKLLLCGLAFLWIVGLRLSSALAQPVELKAVSFLPKDHRLCAMFPSGLRR